ATIVSIYCTALFPISSPLIFFFQGSRDPLALHSFPTRRSSDLRPSDRAGVWVQRGQRSRDLHDARRRARKIQRYRSPGQAIDIRSEEHTSELQSPYDLVCRLLLEKKKKKKNYIREIKHQQHTEH